MNATSSIPYTVAGNRQSTFLLDVVGNQFRQEFTYYPSHQLAESEGYVCFVPLITTYALLPEMKAPIHPFVHIFDLIPEAITEAAAQGRAVLVFDSSCEGDPVIEAGYRHLHTWLAEHGISHSAVVLINQNRVLGKTYKANLDGDIIFAHYDYWIKQLLNTFGASEANFESSMGFRLQDIHFREELRATKTFLCMNGAPRVHRVVLLAALLAASVLDDTVWSMLGPSSGKTPPLSIDVARDCRDRLSLQSVTNDHIDAIVAQVPKILDEETEAIANIRNSNQLGLVIGAKIYDSAFCSIVSETEFSGGEVKRITEKTIKALAMGHPTIVFGNPNSLSVVRDLGFATFADVIDESYDAIDVPAQRFARIIETIRALQALRYGGERQKIALLRDICTHNIEFARHSAVAHYEDTIERELIEVIQNVYANRAQHR
jgi:hypothetical protein